MLAEFITFEWNTEAINTKSVDLSTHAYVKYILRTYELPQKYLKKIDPVNY